MAGSEGPNASDSLALDSHASGPEEPVEPAGGPLQEPVPQEESAADSEGGPKDSEALALVPPSGALQLFSDRAMESLFKLSQEKGGPNKADLGGAGLGRQGRPLLSVIVAHAP